MLSAVVLRLEQGAVDTDDVVAGQDEALGRRIGLDGEGLVFEGSESALGEQAGYGGALFTNRPRRGC